MSNRAAGTSYLSARTWAYVRRPLSTSVTKIIRYAPCNTIVYVRKRNNAAHRFAPIRNVHIHVVRVFAVRPNARARAIATQSVHLFRVPPDATTYANRLFTGTNYVAAIWFCCPSVQSRNARNRPDHRLSRVKISNIPRPYDERILISSFLFTFDGNHDIHIFSVVFFKRLFFFISFVRSLKKKKKLRFNSFSLKHVIVYIYKESSHNHIPTVIRWHWIYVRSRELYYVIKEICTCPLIQPPI